jgi:hypothetical protein
VNPFGFLHFFLLNFLGREKTFLSDFLTHFLSRAHAEQQSFIFFLYKVFYLALSCPLKNLPLHRVSLATVASSRCISPSTMLNFANKEHLPLPLFASCFVKHIAGKGFTKCTQFLHNDKELFIYLK